MLLAQDIVQNTQITSHYYLLTLLVALPTPSNTAFTFWMRESSLHRTFIRMPYAVHKGIICLPSFPFSLGTAMATKKSSTSGARSFISVRIVSHLNSTKDLGFLQSSRNTDGWPVVLTHNFSHCESTSFKNTCFTAFLKRGIFITTSAIWCGLPDCMETMTGSQSSGDNRSLLQKSWR